MIEKPSADPQAPPSKKPLDPGKIPPVIIHGPLPDVLPDLVPRRYVPEVAEPQATTPTIPGTRYICGHGDFPEPCTICQGTFHYAVFDRLPSFPQAGVEAPTPTATPVRQLEALRFFIDEVTAWAQKSKDEESTNIYAYCEGAAENLSEVRAAFEAGAASQGAAEASRGDAATEEESGHAMAGKGVMPNDTTQSSESDVVGAAQSNQNTPTYKELRDEFLSVPRLSSFNGWLVEVKIPELVREAKK